MQQKALDAHEVTNTEVAMHQSGQHSGKQANMDFFHTPFLGSISRPWWPHGT